MKKTSVKPLLIGAHCSAQGGAYKALLHGRSIGASTIQLFVKNQKQWKAKPLLQEEIDLWTATQQETQIDRVTCHGGYLINLASSNDDVRAKSLASFADEITRCQALNIEYFNFHPGAATGDCEERAIEKVIDALISLAPIITSGSTIPLLETTAGQGTCIGYRFEHLKAIIDGTRHIIPLHVCIDTCHIFSAGYDIRTPETFHQTLEEFDRIVGLKHLKLLHLNDSMKDFGLRRDRHASLGKGFIGLYPFEALVTDPRTRDLPMILETPDGDAVWQQEIQFLNAFHQGHSV